MELRYFAIDRTKPLILGRTVHMPDTYQYPDAAVRVYFDNIRIETEKPYITFSNENYGNGTVVAKVQVRPLFLHSDFIIETFPDPPIDVDTAGNLEIVSNNPATESEKEEWLEQARKERTRLAATKNGQQLLCEYGRHNEVYNEVMQTKSFQRSWKEKGLTEMMARDTNDAVKNDKVINDKVYMVKNDSGTYEKHTYNGHAFREKTALSLAVSFREEQTEQKKYADAGNAIDSFDCIVKGTVSTETGDIYLKPSEVYSKVEEFSAGDTAVFSSDYSNQNSGPVVLNYYKNRYAKRINQMKTNVSQDEAESDKYGLEGLYLSLLKESVENTAAIGDVAYTGECNTDVSIVGFDADVVIGYDTSETVFDLPDFDIDIKMQGCDIMLAKIVGREFSRSEFIQYLIRDSIQSGISEWLKNEVKEEAKQL